MHTTFKINDVVKITATDYILHDINFNLQDKIAKIIDIDTDIYNKLYLYLKIDTSNIPGVKYKVTYGAITPDGVELLDKTTNCTCTINNLMTAGCTCGHLSKKN